MKTLVLLQNAWSPHYAGKTWPRVRWLGALEMSRSGSRLIRLTGIAPTAENDSVWYDNTTPIVGPTPDSVVPIDTRHVAKLLARKPELVIACGKQAHRAVAGWTGRLIVMPHPAYRLLNNNTIDIAREVMESGCPPRAIVWPHALGSGSVQPLELLNAERTDEPVRGVGEGDLQVIDAGLAAG